MSCFICLDDKGKMMKQGCVCKGSICIHESCFKVWCTSSKNPFLCSVCKTSLSPVLLEKYLGIEKIMFFKAEKEEEEEYYEEDTIFINHGVRYIIEDGFLRFESEKDMTLYMESGKKENDSQKKMIRNHSIHMKNSFRMKINKMVHNKVRK